ncbi:hypothetical protein ABZ297_04185 [Nonomuraea sp. NPDC005983]|uniref:hypothetical protein n=1 Tax=Nonomuraea sp. NPDC005983 TaxID=3155595 RepID=UPI0033BA248D
MTSAPGRRSTTHPPQCHGYEIRIRGRVSASFRDAFGGLAVTVNPVETVVWGADLDQAALYSVLERIQALGLELVEVRRFPRDLPR